MPPAVIAAGIGAAGVLGGSIISSRSSNKATQASADANKQALDYTKEQDAARRAEYDKAMTAYQAQWEAWNAQRMGLLQRYGVNVTGMSPQQPQQQPQQGPGSLVNIPAPANIMTAGAGGAINPQAASAIQRAALQGKTVADLMQQGSQPQNWDDWSRLGLRAQ